MWFNPLILWLLYSLLYGLISGNTMVINFIGRKTGKNYRVPIGYVQIENILTTASLKQRKWWRNLRGGEDVTLHLRGVDVAGHAEVVEDDGGVIEGLKEFISRSDLWRRRAGVAMTPDGQLDEASLRAVAAPRVIVRIILR